MLGLWIWKQELWLLVQLRLVSTECVTEHKLTVWVKVVESSVVHSERHLHVVWEVCWWHGWVEAWLTLSKLLLTVSEGASFLVWTRLALLVELALNSLINHRVILLLVLHVWLELMHVSIIVLTTVESTSVHLLVSREISSLVLWVLKLTHVLSEFN